MEGFLKSAEQREEISNWRELKEQAVAAADARILNIEGFNTMSSEEKVWALDVLLDELSEDNENRYIAREVALRGEQLKEVVRHSVRMAELGVTA